VLYSCNERKGEEFVKRATLTEIARLAGVNPSTVSRALNPVSAALISEERRNKIIALCDKLNYRPQRAARGCATGKSYTIGFISGALQKDFSSPFISRYISAIATELQHNNYSLTLLSADGDAGNLHKNVKDIILSDIADGYITSYGMLKEKTQEIFRCSGGRPVLSLGYHNFDCNADVSYVEINTENAIAELWQVINSNLPGSRCCFFAKPTNSSASKIAKINRLAPAGTHVEAYYIPDPVNYSLMDYAQSAARAEELWKEFFKFDVIWCGSDLVAAGVCDVLRRHGAIPGKDIMVIGYDHLAAVVPGFNHDLATIDPCWEKAGILSARRILDLVRDRETEKISERINAVYVPGKTFPFTLNT
jgi:LacI family transcriptional regulator